MTEIINYEEIKRKIVVFCPDCGEPMTKKNGTYYCNDEYCKVIKAKPSVYWDRGWAKIIRSSIP